MAVVQCIKCCLPQQTAHQGVDDEDSDVVDTDLIKVKPAWHGRTQLSKALYADIVNAPTSPERWFTPHAGWPTAVSFAGGSPENLMPTPPNVPHDFFNPVSMAVGEVRIEILETDALPKMDPLPGQANDVYAMLIFEESIARTATIQNVDSPKWHAECARAFRFPIFAPHSPLYVALFDSDEDEWINVIDKLGQAVDSVDSFTSQQFDRRGTITHGRAPPSSPASGAPSAASDTKELASPTMSERLDALTAYASDRINRRKSSTWWGAESQASAQRTNTKADDQIGRVCIDLRLLHADTVYDSWFELRRSAVLDDAGTLGAVRLRYSVTWTQPSAKMLARYLSPPPSFVLPTKTAQVNLCARFAIHGNHADGGEMEEASEGGGGGDGGAEFGLRVLMAHGYELKEIMYGGLDYAYALEGVVTYSDPMLSLFLCALWQLVCSYPRLLPSMAPLCALLLLRATYREHRERHSGVLSSPSFSALALSIVLPSSLSRFLLSAQASRGACERYAAEVPTQEGVMQRRAEAERAKAEKLELEAARMQALENALRHPGGVASEVKEGLETLATNILGKETISYWSAEMPHHALLTLQKAGDRLARGQVIEAGGTLIARTARVATKAATTVVGSGVNTVRLAATTVGTALETTRGTVFDPTVALSTFMASSGEYYQSLLAYYLAYLRAASGVLTWRDPALTTYLCLLLLATMLVLPLLPWQLVSRAAGALLLGPHMWILGSRRRKAAREALLDTLEERANRIYAEPSAAQRRSLLAAERERREHEAEMAARSEEEARRALPLARSASSRRAYVRQLRGRGLHGEIENQGSRVCLSKLPFTPDPDRSSAFAPWGRPKRKAL